MPGETSRLLFGAGGSLFGHQSFVERDEGPRIGDGLQRAVGECQIELGATAFCPLHRTDDFYFHVPDHKVDTNLFGDKFVLVTSGSTGDDEPTTMRSGRSRCQAE